MKVGDEQEQARGPRRSYQQRHVLRGDRGSRATEFWFGVAEQRAKSRVADEAGHAFRYEQGQRERHRCAPTSARNTI